MNDRFPRLLRLFPIRDLLSSEMILSSRNAAVQKLRQTRHFSINVVPSPMERRTIYALSTPPGRGGIGVIRVSGPDALDVYSRMVHAGGGGNLKGKCKGPTPEPWKMRRCSIVHPESQEVLDEGMAVFYRGPSLMFDGRNCLVLKLVYSTTLFYY